MLDRHKRILRQVSVVMAGLLTERLICDGLLILRVQSRPSVRHFGVCDLGGEKFRRLLRLEVDDSCLNFPSPRVSLIEHLGRCSFALILFLVSFLLGHRFFPRFFLARHLESLREEDFLSRLHHGVFDCLFRRSLRDGRVSPLGRSGSSLRSRRLVVC